MEAALDEARRALAFGEVPIGAVVVIDGQIVARGHNRPISTVDPTAHAEVVALREAARAVESYRLLGSTLYVTVEPCLMCVGALVHARVDRLVYGAPEPRTGALVSAVQGLDLPGLNHRFDVIGGVLEVPSDRSGVLSRAASAGIMKCSRRLPCPRRSHIPDRRGTEVVVTGAPRKRLVRKGTWVRIPPSPPLSVNNYLPELRLALGFEHGNPGSNP
jgi:tRNA(adenine34) deaminase